MSINVDPRVLTPILKRARSNSSSSDVPTPKKLPTGDSNECEEMVTRISETGLASSYITELAELSACTSAKQLTWLLHLSANVAVLNKDRKDFVFKCIDFPWKVAENFQLRSAYQHFIVSLVTAHTEFCKPALRRLFNMLLPVIEGNEAALRLNPHMIQHPSVHSLAIDTIVAVYDKVPMSEVIIVAEANKCRPYFKKHPHLLLVYTKGLLILGDTIPDVRKRLLEMIIHSLITIDVNCPRDGLVPDDDDDEDDSDVFKMEVDKPQQTNAAKLDKLRKERIEWIMEHPVGHSLDVLMDVLMLYIHCVAHRTPFTFNYNKDLSALHALNCVPGSVKRFQRDPIKQDDETDEQSEAKFEFTLGCQCGGELHDIAAVKQLYLDLRDVFVKIVLPTHSTAHVQFIMFYLLSIRPGLTSIFLEYLRIKIFEDQTLALDVRKNAMAYFGSLLARGTFVHFSLVQSCLEVIINWCHTYITKQQTDQTNNYHSLSLHQLFYCACQTVFYVFSFRCHQFTRNERTLNFVRNLNLDHLVLSKLNPLTVCTSSIVNNFAAITRHYQICYCYAVIEANRRTTLPISCDYGEGKMMAYSLTGSELDMFFPFDPYLLVGSSRYITQHFQQFSGLPDFINTEADSNEVSLNKSSDDTVDDFLDQSGPDLNGGSFLQ